MYKERREKEEGRGEQAFETGPCRSVIVE